MNRKLVEDMIAKRIAQAVVLANHLKDDPEPFEDYVSEKANTYPTLDSFNKRIFEVIVGQLNATYGLNIKYASWSPV